MKIADLRIRLARAWLRFGRKESFPPTLQEAYELGAIRADILASRLSLSEQETAILKEVVQSEVILHHTTPQNAIKNGLEEVLRFRTFQRAKGENCELVVAFIPSSDWPKEWEQERRLGLVFEPRMSISENTLRTPELDTPIWVFQPNCLTVITYSNQFPHLSGKTELNRFRNISLKNRIYPFNWKGSHVKIQEEREPYDIGRGNVPVWTSFDIKGFLAAPTYNFIREKLDTFKDQISEKETLWLAISVPFSGNKIPHQHYVGPGGKIDNPCLLVQDAPRLCIQLARVPISEDITCYPKIIDRWMAIER